MNAFVWSLFVAAMIAGVIAAKTHADMVHASGQLAVAAIFFFVFLVVAVPIFLVAARRARAGRVAALLEGGFTASHRVKLGSVELLFDAGREEWALVDSRQTQRFAYDQFDRSEWHFDPSRNGALKLESKVMTYDPARPFYHWMLAGRAADGERWAQRITAILNA